MITSLLIANRGEIACRIIRTARRMGIRTIAVYSDADARALHVRQADEAVPIGASPACESYLVGEKIIAAAKATGAEAVHPGYGFLSENADFAQAVIDAGLIWVGPKPHSIRAMGLKDAAKTLMAEAGVPIVPGYMGKKQAPAFLAERAAEIGYPVLIKAVAGGGGKGMRLVERPKDFADALASCRREASAAFGNDHVLIEKYIQRPRHIEVQVFGDIHGNIVHLFERDCSLQRRHQKVIEEAPAPGMDEATRTELCAAAVRAAKAVDYVGAGTIEFIADASDGLRADRIWFMEMNTRLQVEHPVTEEITGQDLVEWQLRVASGEPLPKKQDELAIDGWAMEARLYAENPATGFLPSVGTLEKFCLPGTIRQRRYQDQLGTNVETDHRGVARIETGVGEGDEISPFYDPMIAKIICHADDRVEAAVGLAALMTDVQVWPIRTNATFLALLAQAADFLDGNVDTGFIERHPNLLVDPPPPPWVLDQAAVLLTGAHGPAQKLIGFRLNAPPRTEVRMMDRDNVFTGSAVREQSYSARNHALVSIEQGRVIATALGATWRLEPIRFSSTAAGRDGDGAILSPMPGRIIAVDVAAGQSVTKGQKLVTLEAMKMEHSLTAPFDGRVTELNAKAGGQVIEGTLLARIEAEKK